MPLVLEDNVIDLFASDLRTRGAAILAEGGNQMRAFRFITESGRRKAPDLVIYLNGVLAIFEAKVEPRDLFRASSGGPSDYEVVLQIAKEPGLQDQLVHEAKRRLIACGLHNAVLYAVCAGMIASRSIINQNRDAGDAGIILINVDMLSCTYHTEATNQLWTHCLLSTEMQSD